MLNEERNEERNEGRNEEREEANECEACYDKFTDKIKKKVVCPGCCKVFCLKCVKRWLLQRASIISADASYTCMSCKLILTESYIHEICSSRTFLSYLSMKRSHAIMNYEKSLIPMTMIFPE